MRLAAHVSSGANITVTLTAKDAYDNNIATGGSTISFSRSGGTSTGTFGSVSDNSNGTYSATFTGVTAGTATDILAQINAVAVTTTSPQVTVTSGATSEANSLITVSSGTVSSGNNVTLTLTAIDGAGNPITSGGSTVVFNYSGGSSTGTIGATTDNGDGTYNATFTGVLAGTPTSIGATMDGNAITSTLPTVTVNPGAVSVSQSLVTVSTDTVNSGANVTLNLQAKDSAGNTITAGGETIVFSHSGGTSTGAIGSTTDNANGTYSATFTAQASGTATTIGATIGGTPVSSTLPTVTVNVGALSLAQSTISVSSASITSGGTSTLTLYVRDAYGNSYTTGGHTVLFNSSGGSSTGTINSTTDNSNGTYTATFTGVLAGTATTIGATIGGSAVSSSLPTITVGAGTASAAQSIISVSSGTVASGSNITLTLQAKDAAGNTISSGGRTVVFSRSGGTSTGTVGSTTDNADGTYAASFTGLVAGTPTTISATINGTPVTTTLPTVTVTPGGISLSQSLVTVSSSTVTSGSQITVSVQAKDGAGNSLTSGGATVVFNYSGGSSTGGFGATTDNADGSYQATFTGQAAGSATTITATINASAVTSTLPTVTVTVGSLSLAQSTVSVSSGSIASGADSTLTVQARDAYGNNFTTGGFVVLFNNTGGTSTGTISGTTDNNNGSYTATFTGVIAGTATTIGATIDGAAVASSLPTITVGVGIASATQSLISVSSATVASGSNITLTLQAKDAAGNIISSGGRTVAFSRSGGSSTGTVGSTTDNADGTYEASFTGLVAGTPTTINATINGTPVTTTLPTVTVTPGSISLSQSLVTVSSSTVVSGSQITISLQAKDAAGNNLTSGGATVAFGHSGGSSTGSLGSTTDNADGTYQATFTGQAAGSATTITATINASAVTSTLPTVTVSVGSLSLAQSTVSVSTGSIASGGVSILTVQARDAYGNNFATGGFTVFFNTSGGTSTGAIGSTTDNNNGSYTASFTGVIAGTATTIGATIGGAAVSSSLPTITVTPGIASASQSTISVSGGTVASGSNINLYLQAKDAAGNTISSGGRTVVFSYSGGSSTGTVGSTTDNADGTYQASFTGLVAGTATTIHATINGSTVTTTLPTVTVTPGSISTTQSLVSVSSSTVASGSGITVSLQAKDNAGNNLTTGGATVVFSHSGGSSTGSLGSTTDNANGSYQATFTGEAAGSATTITATINASAVSSTLPTVTVTVGTLSLAQSSVTVSAASIASGANSTLTLQARDAYGNDFTTGGLTVLFNNTGGSSTGTIGSVTDNNDGSYSATFTGVLAGTATTIGGTIGGSAVTSSLPTITVGFGSISVTQSEVSVSSGSVVSGSDITLTLTAKDNAGNSISSGGEAVAFTYSGGSSTGSIGSVTDNGDGTYTANFTGVLAGSATTINSTINATPVSSSLPTVAVTPGSISTAQSLISVSSSTVASAANITLTLQAKDAAGNNLVTGGATVVFSHSGGSSTGNIGATTDVGNGTYTATFTGQIAGTATTITGTIGGVSVSSSLPTVTVIPGPVSLSQSLVSVSSGSVASGSQVTLTLQAKDALGNNLIAGGLSVVFSRTGGTSTGSVGGTTDMGNGTYTALFTGAVAGTPTTINATIGGSPVTSSLPTVTVTPGSPSAAQSIVSVSSGTVVSGNNVTLTLLAKDPSGNTVTVGGSTIVFTHSGGTSTGSMSGVTDNTNGTYTATFTGVLAGTATTINATLNGVSVTTLMPTVAVSVGAISTSQSLITVSQGTISSGNGATLTLYAKDNAGNSLSTGGSTIVFSRSGGTSTGNISATTDLANGTYTATFTGVIAGTATTIHATIGGVSVTSTLPTLTVIPGAVSTTTSLVTVSSATVNSGDNISLNLQAKDNAGNNVLVGGKTVAFSYSGGDSTGSISATTDNSNGTYTATFTGVISGSATTIHALINGVNVTSTLPTVSVLPGNISVNTSTISVSSGSVTSGLSITLTLSAKDAAGNTLSSGGSTVAFGYSGGQSTGSIGATTDVGDGTYTANFTGVLAGTPTNITATIGGVAVTTTSPSVTVNPGAATASTSTVTVSSSTVASGSAVVATVHAKDAAGNNLTSGGLSIGFSHSGGTSTGSFGSVTDVGNGTYTANFTGYTAGTATTINATINSNPITTTLPTVTVNAGPISKDQSIVTVSQGSILSGSNVTLTLIGKDAAGNILSSGGATVGFSYSGGTSTGNIGTVTDQGNGTYTATFTGNVAGTATTVSATINAQTVATVMPTITVLKPNPPSAVTLTDPASTPGNDQTPTFLVSGVALNHTVKLYTNSICSNLVATQVSGGATVSITSGTRPEGSYNFYANTTDPQGNTSNCSSAFAPYEVDITPPSVITNLTHPSGTTSSSSINGISWTKSVSPDAHHYLIALGTSAGASDVVTWSNIGDVAGYSFTGLSLSECSSYYVGVKAVDNAGNVSSSVNSSAILYDGTAPGSPVVSSQTGYPQVDVSKVITWTSGSDNCAISHYLVGIGTSAGDDDAVAWENVGTNLSQQFTGISPYLSIDTDYYLSVKTVDFAGNESTVAAGARWQVSSAKTGLFAGTTTTSSSAPTDLNQSTPEKLVWSSNSLHPDYFAHTPGSENVVVKVAGNYQLSLTLPIYRTNTSNSQPTAIQAKIKINNIVYDYPVAESTYMAPNSGHDHSSGHLHVLLDSLSADDVISIEVNQQTNYSHSNYISSQATLFLEYIDPSDTIFKGEATQTTLGTNLNQTSTGYLQWTEIIEDTGYTHSDASNSDRITLDNAGDYLVFVDIPVSGSVTDGGVDILLYLNGASVTGGSAGQGYIQNGSGHNQSSLHYVGLISATAGQYLRVGTYKEAGTGTITVTSGYTANIFIKKVESAEDIISLRATQPMSGTNWNPASLDTVKWSTSDIKDAGIFSHSTSTNPDQITVLEPGDYMVSYNDYLYSSDNRPNPQVFIYVNGSPVTGAECSTHFIRDGGSALHRNSSCALYYYLPGLNQGDIISVGVIREAGTSTNVTSADDAKLFIWRR